jgi:uncharacterized peroxidase-related enzyme
MLSFPDRGLTNAVLEAEHSPAYAISILWLACLPRLSGDPRDGTSGSRLCAAVICAGESLTNHNYWLTKERDVANSTSTLTPEYRSKDPYGWLGCDDSYQLPAEWLAVMPVPEKHSSRIVASYDEAGFARGGAFVMPVFFDPSYGLLTLAEREFIGVIVSAINCCPTCLIIHGHNLGKYIGDHGRARRIAINYRAVDLSVEERAIADYCVKMTEQPGRLEAADLQILRDAGLSDARIYYIIELAAVFNLTNRMTSGYGMRPDDDFMLQIGPRPSP